MEFLDRLKSREFREEYCSGCDKKSGQLYQSIVIPKELGGKIEFYQCLNCNAPLSVISGESLSENELLRLQTFIPLEYKNRPLTELGIVVKVL